MQSKTINGHEFEEGPKKTTKVFHKKDKVFCSDCKYNGWWIINDFSDICYAPKNNKQKQVKEKDNWFERGRTRTETTKRDASDINKNMDCSWYEEKK